MTSSVVDPGAVAAIAGARHGDPFSVLGMHVVNGAVIVRAMLPQASAVDVIDAQSGSTVASLERIHDDGFFAGVVPERTTPFPYRLAIHIGRTVTIADDAYRFGLVLGDVDLYLFGESTHRRLYERFGAHLRTFDGVDGATFVVWAPNARRVSVVGDWNDWDGRRHPMRRRTGGVWELFVPAVTAGARYKYELLGPSGEMLPLKSDPMAFACEQPPSTASIVAEAGQHDWHDQGWHDERARANRRDAPISAYEVHLGSWQRADGNRYLTYDELADRLIPYAVEMGFTHLELMPVAEHPFDGSWGYQPIGLFAPTSRFGSPRDFARFVDRAHEAGLGVLIDWVPGHFPSDAHGLGRFDGTALYEHADPREGFQPDWNTYVFNFGRAEVRNFLIANALFWLDVYHIDGLRVDAVASMLYRDYSRKDGEWIPNRFGGRENLEAIEFLQTMNADAYGSFPGIMTVAEESTAWPNVSRPIEAGGLGFGYKWNMGWMHDVLHYLHEDPINRRYHQNEITFSFVYAFTENFVLPLSHDEVVYGKGSLLGKMPGDTWQRFANLRLLFGWMFGHPGKKLLFMGGEFGQVREWNHDRSLDWYLLDQPEHRGMRAFVHDCNAVYRSLPALHDGDADDAGLEWITARPEESIVAIARHSPHGGPPAIVIGNFTPVVRRVRIGVPTPGRYVTKLNGDDAQYGGSGVSNGELVAEAIPWDDKPWSIELTLPPLAALILANEA